eukprot:2731128-Prymnesium_polylepis.1
MCRAFHASEIGWGELRRARALERAQRIAALLLRRVVGDHGEDVLRLHRGVRALRAEGQGGSQAGAHRAERVAPRHRRRRELERLRRAEQGRSEEQRASKHRNDSRPRADGRSPKLNARGRSKLLGDRLLEGRKAFSHILDVSHLQRLLQIVWDTWRAWRVAVLSELKALGDEAR